ncbi:hypothetical protein [Lyngbya confervoides]|uniref:Uncharacterized protein n=1 Tax=Lyngbya confervoides BDU141951 TaxID=1574623 RepID=A0ABD4SY13_9CYAN|nr:hypothetical protein [Lyngbya confervoides]MCM1981354.1 hypothetical protein [Lyngbya confervoides BDU141951]
MASAFSLAPRYRLDDESPWLRGIDPLRQYHIQVNGDRQTLDVIPGLRVSTAELKLTLGQVRSLAPGEALRIPVGLESWLDIHCVSDNCYGLASNLQGAPVWHLLDAEALESLLMTAHPDWQSNMTTLDLGRQQIFQPRQPAAV